MTDIKPLDIASVMSYINYLNNSTSNSINLIIIYHKLYR